MKKYHVHTYYKFDYIWGTFQSGVAVETEENFRSGVIVEIETHFQSGVIEGEPEVSRNIIVEPEVLIKIK